ncbi:MAG: hypothetical protein KDB14_03695 [Planctomycetales bacterium]|nr:hypothetical protein [Planctomycetales bacterium]
MKHSRLLAACCVIFTLAFATAELRAQDSTVGGFILRMFNLAPAQTARPAVVIERATTEVQPVQVAGEAEGTGNFETTHTDQSLISLKDNEGNAATLHTFCLAKNGNVLAGCGSPGAGEIRMFTPDGKYLETWSLPVLPEAINTDPEGNVLVAGEGKLVQLSAQGKQMLIKDAPHVASMQDNREQLREQLKQQYKARANSYAQTLEIYQRQIEMLEEKAKEGELSDAEKSRLEIYKRARTSLEGFVAKQKEEGEPELSDAQLDAQLSSLMSSRSKVASISATDTEVFLACNMSVGYGYQVYRLDRQFENPVSIIKDLRGCCGQMDVQANANGVFVAENSRHRVAHFDREGETVGAWGSRDRTGEKGFTSCCNPMNVCFGPNQSVYTAESTTGLIKQFDKQGKLLNYVATVKLVPGCKKVSIAVSPSGDSVYMMDITRHHIVKLSRPAGDSADANEETAAGGE